MRRLPSWNKLNPRSRSRPRLRLPFALAVLLFWAAPSALLAATFTATLDRETMTVGETATLTLSFKGGEPKSIPVPPALPNLQITGEGTSRAFSFDNGQVSSSISQNFALIPTQPGEFNIPALRAEIDGQVLTTQPLKLTAVKASSSAANGAGQLAFFQLIVPKKEVYVGEILAVEFRVFVREGVANAENILQ